MTGEPQQAPLSDEGARIEALTRHDRSLLVEAGAGSGKTALMAGRAALLVAGGTAPRNIAAITFTEAAAAELLERIDRIVRALVSGKPPTEIGPALPAGLNDAQRANLEDGADTLDELTCTTIHGFCQKLITPYPVESGQDPGASIIDPAVAELAFDDLADAWLSARFGRDPAEDGLGRLPRIEHPGEEGEDLFAALLQRSPDQTLRLIRDTAHFLRVHRTAGAAVSEVDREACTRFVEAAHAFAAWYEGTGIEEAGAAAIADDLLDTVEKVGNPWSGRITADHVAGLLHHGPPDACKKGERAFKQWRAKGKWRSAARAAGLSASDGEMRFADGLELYETCSAAYGEFCYAVAGLAVHRFISEFDAIRELYREYKRDAALLDFDDLLYQARDLLRDHEPVRKALSRRYTHILVDEFQDTDPLQAEIIWRLAGEGDPGGPWQERRIRPGALFLVGDPKQAIYRFRGADVQTYLTARDALSRRDPASVISITANFRSREPILTYVNGHFRRLLDETRGQPGFTPLTATRDGDDETIGPSVAAFDVVLGDEHRTGRGRLIVERVREEEARVVAGITARLIGSYPVYDADNGITRPAQASDIALLAPTGTSLWIYERALEENGIPIATQAGKGFFRRQEVQDLIAVARAVADARDTLAFGALIRGPLVGLSDEQIADEICALPVYGDRSVGLDVKTDPCLIKNPVLRQTLHALQKLRRKRRATTPYQIMAEAVEALGVRPVLMARHHGSAARALGNVDLLLEMARPYAARGIEDFARALWQSWADAEDQVEGRHDEGEDAVSIITMHSAKGLEWPVVIPINSTTGLRHQDGFLYRRRDDTVHFKVLGQADTEYEETMQEEIEELNRERVRLWYVSLTRARDLLILPRQSERVEGDWMSLIDVDVDTLPAFDAERYKKTRTVQDKPGANRQDRETWLEEAAAIARNLRTITWRRPSRHEDAVQADEEDSPAVFAGEEEAVEAIDEPAGGGSDNTALKRGLILHKLMEEVLTGETADDHAHVQARARELIEQQELNDSPDASARISSVGMAEMVIRTLERPEIASLRPRLAPEYWVYGSDIEGREMAITAGIADAVTFDDDGRIDVVVDWKSDARLRERQIRIYREQVGSYLKATGARTGHIVYLGLDHIETVTA